LAWSNGKRHCATSAGRPWARCVLPVDLFHSAEFDRIPFGDQGWDDARCG